jgi:secondary thiamine-phosphate synthase enzyme
MVVTAELSLQTSGHTDIHEITDAVQREVSHSGLRNGTVTVFTPSSTSALTTIEYEEGALADLRRVLEQIAPVDGAYQHNLRWGDGNGYAHLRAALLGPSLNIPFMQGRLYLGTWQQVIFLDFDNRPRRRTIMMQIIGE